MSKHSVIHWFRKGLRLHDNPALHAAIESAEGKHELRCIFILDPWIVKKLRVGPNRWRFLQQSLQDLDNSLCKFGSRLYVLRGKPEEVFPRIFSDWKVKCLTFELDTEPYAVERDERIEALAKKAGVKVIQKVSHTLYCTEIVIRSNLGKPPLTYQKFVSVLEQMGPPPKPVPAPTQLPHSDKLVERDCDVPTLAELGVDESKLLPCIYPGGESEALARMELHLKRKAWILKFEKPNTAPNTLEPSTTVLSPYLKFGCLSVRTLYYKLQEVLRNSTHTKPPVSLIGQLFWREFFYTVAAGTPNFDRMVGNSICVQVPWDKNEEYLKAWAEGRTGYPFIDAIMTQLRHEGWIHHLARHAVACFLTRGDLWISWEEGKNVFEELLLDADWALNAGNWLWLSASAFFHQFFRVYSPVAFGKKTDKFGEYIKKYVPVLKKIPAEYIYEPWKAPLSVQKAANCIIGQDYPKRIVIHEDVYKANIAKMSKAYKNSKVATDKRKEEDDGRSPVKKFKGKKPK